MTCNEKNLGARLRQIRKERGLKQYQLANMVGLSFSYTCQIEKGQRAIGVDVLAAICNALQVSPNRLLLDLE